MCARELPILPLQFLGRPGERLGELEAEVASGMVGSAAFFHILFLVEISVAESNGHADRSYM